MEAKLTYRRRKAILSRLEDLSYMRDAPSAYEEQKKVETEMYALAREAVSIAGHGGLDARCPDGWSGNRSLSLPVRSPG
jgi:hypothetical protein